LFIFIWDLYFIERISSTLEILLVIINYLFHYHLHLCAGAFKLWYLGRSEIWITDCVFASELQLAIIFSHWMKIQLNCEFYFVRLLLRRIDALKQKAILQVSWMLWNYVDEWALSLFKDNLSALRNVDFGSVIARN